MGPLSRGGHLKQGQAKRPATVAGRSRGVRAKHNATRWIREPRMGGTDHEKRAAGGRHRRVAGHPAMDDRGDDGLWIEQHRSTGDGPRPRPEGVGCGRLTPRRGVWGRMPRLGASGKAYRKTSSSPRAAALRGRFVCSTPTRRRPHGATRVRPASDKDATDVAAVRRIVQMRNQDAALCTQSS